MYNIKLSNVAIFGLEYRSILSKIKINKKFAEKLSTFLEVSSPLKGGKNVFFKMKIEV